MDPLANPLIKGVRPFIGGGVSAPLETVDSAPLDSTIEPLASSIAAPTATFPALGTSLVRSPATQMQSDATERNRLVNSGDGISQIHNPLLRGIARAGDIAASVFAPNVASFIPGTTLHHNMLVNQAERNVQRDQEQEKNVADIAGMQAQTRHVTDEAQALENPRDKFAPVQTDSGLAAFDPSTGKAVPVMSADGSQLGSPAKAKTIEEQAYEYAVKSGKNPLEAYGLVYGAKNQKDANLPQQYLDAISSGDKTKAALIKQVIQDTQVQPKIDVHAAEAPAGAAGTWQMVMDKDNNPKFFNSKTGEVRDNATGITKGKGDRATVDEQKRADLAKNMNENLDAMEDIVTRRPELFGPIAGRMTEAKAGFGTDDPDIAKMINIKHQLGMVAQGTHGMRSAQGIESAANGLLGGFHNSPAATKAALESARVSARTFLDDANHPGQSRGDSSGGSSSGLAVSLKDAMALPQFKGKSQSEVTAAIKAAGHEVRP